MNKECYLLTSDEAKEKFTFFSVGPKGIIKKVIKYEWIGGRTYNLAFGEWNATNDTIDDTARTNNGDRDKVLNTVARSIMQFMENHPNATILAIGESRAKTRLYQIGITKNLAEISSQYSIQGFRNGRWMTFSPG
jgi:hypothetical protein